MASQQKTSKHSDNNSYTQKKAFFESMLTIYGRKPVLEALHDSKIVSYKLHLAESNKPCKILTDITNLAEQKNIDIEYHSKQALSRISKNGKQDQGIALDIQCEKFMDEEQLLETLPDNYELIALDGVTNPQNLGMIIRSLCASPIHALLLPQKNSAKLDSLVIKASSGTLFRAPIVRCGSLEKTLETLSKHNTSIFGVDAGGNTSIENYQSPPRVAFVLGNETKGISPEVRARCDDFMSIPMLNGVESLNVAVTASLIAFRSVLNTTKPEK